MEWRGLLIATLQACEPSTFSPPDRRCHAFCAFATCFLLLRLTPIIIIRRSCPPCIQGRVRARARDKHLGRTDAGATARSIGPDGSVERSEESLPPVGDPPRGRAQQLPEPTGQADGRFRDAGVQQDLYSSGVSTWARPHPAERPQRQGSAGG